MENNNIVFLSDLKTPKALRITLLFFVGSIAPLLAQPLLMPDANPSRFETTVSGTTAQSLQSTESCNWVLSTTVTGFSFTTPNTGTQNVTIAYTPPVGAPTCPADISVSLTLSNGNNNAADPPRVYTLRGCVNPAPPTGLPVDVVMVVDVSGSMGDSDGCVSAPSLSKIDYLKSKMGAMYSSMRTSFMSNPAHRFGLVTFSNTASTPVSLQSFSTTSNIDAQINSMTAAGATSMGAGLVAAVNMLGGVAPNSSRNRVILLLTNGMQNTSPMVERSGASTIINTTPTVTTLSGSDIKIIPYAIFTPDGTYMDLLNGLAALNGSNAWGVTTAARICNIGENLQTNWINGGSLTGSPRQIAFRKGQIAGSNGTEEYTIKEQMDQLTLYVSSVGNVNYTGLKVEQKSGGGNYTDITALGTITPSLSTPAPYRVFVLGGVSTVGDYRLSFTANQPNVFYESSAIVDDRELKQDFFAMPVVAAGEPLFLGTSLRQSGVAVTDATVRAIIYAPKKRLNNNFAGQRVPSQFIEVTNPPWQKGGFGRENPDNWFQKQSTVLVGENAAFKSRGKDGYIKRFAITHPTLPSFREEGSRMKNGEKKYIILMQETDFDKVYEREIVATIPLQHEGNGIYRAQYKGTQKAGLYHVRMEAEGTHPNIGAYKRFEEKTPVVRFGTPDKKRSQLFLLYQDPMILMMRPVDIEGNILGPHQESAIRIALSNGVAYDLTDYLDGRYVSRLSVPAGTDPTVTITIYERILYRGPLSGLNPLRWSFGAQGGLFSPAGDLANGWSPAVFGEARLGYRVYNQFSLVLKGGYQRLTTSVGAEAKADLTHVGLGAGWQEWFNVLNGVYAYGTIHGAAYRWQNNWYGGWSIGTGLRKPLTHYLNVTLDAQRHQVNGAAPANFQFYTTGLGLELRFGRRRPNF
jgi:von Willebrand factor type A domain